MKTLRAGQRVEVGTWTGARIAGDLEVVADDHLLLRAARQEQVPRTEVRVVALPAGRETATRAKRGLIIGAAAGALLNVIGTGGHPAWLLMGALGGGILGAAFGALDGATTVRLEVVYMAPAHAPNTAQAQDRLQDPLAVPGVVGGVDPGRRLW